jgi:hypothetical protein
MYFLRVVAGYHPIKTNGDTRKELHITNVITRIKDCQTK